MRRRPAIHALRCCYQQSLDGGTSAAMTIREDRLSQVASQPTCGLLYCLASSLHVHSRAPCGLASCRQPHGIEINCLAKNRLMYFTQPGPDTGQSRNPQLFQQTAGRRHMNRRSALLLGAGALAFVLTGCASMQRNKLADNLRNALVGAPVTVTQQNDSIVMTSSADYMFPSGGWQIPSDSPVLNKIAPILAKLQNTKIIVRGYTDNRPVVQARCQRCGLSCLAWREPRSAVRPGHGR